VAFFLHVFLQVRFRTAKHILLEIYQQKADDLARFQAKLRGNLIVIELVISNPSGEIDLLIIPYRPDGAGLLAGLLAYWLTGLLARFRSARWKMPGSLCMV
jgi:hypothetical protein